jgi:transposase-like protein
VDVKYLPQMPDEAARQYLFAAIDRATRWVYVEILPDKTAQRAQGFLRRLIERARMRARLRTVGAQAWPSILLDNSGFD